MKKKKVLMAESLGWNALYRIGGHHYARHFTREGYSVCWITHPVSPFHRLSRVYRKYEREIRDKYRVWKKGGMEDNGVIHYTPMTLLPYANAPILRSPWVLHHTLDWTVPDMYDFLREKDFNEVDVVWIDNIALSGLLRKVRHKHSVFRIADDIAAFDDVPNSIRKEEEFLVEAVNTVFVTSKTILERYASFGEKIQYLPNGVDFDFFAQADSSIPHEYRSIPSPRIVYVGAIAEWFDVDMLREAANALPDCSFILIGEPRIDLAQINHLKNMYLLGGRDYRAIPSYLKNADVGIIPFRKSWLVESINPIKLYEYMACGLPVVSTRWKTLEGIQSPAYIADSPDEFVQLIAASLREENGKRYREFARRNSWQKRFETVNKVLGRASSS